MQLTVSLFSPRMWIRMRGEAWWGARRRATPDDANLPRILAAGYQVVDANEFVKPLSPFNTDYESLPDVKSRFPVPPKPDRSHPDWHDEICKVFDDSTFPIEGLQQALAFTKGVQVSSGLPVSLTERANSIQLSEEDHQFAKRIIQQAYIWDAYLEKLPKLKHLDYPSLSPRREFGTPWKRRNEILMMNFIRRLESKVSHDVSLSRMIAPQEELRVNYQRHQSLVQFQLNAIAHIMSNKPLKPVLSGSEVEDTKLLPICDLYPFLSTANMEESNVYREDDHFVVKQSSKFPHIHTSIFSHHIPGSHTHIHPRWTDDRFAGTTVMYNFATALLMAKQKFGTEYLGILPEPITTQVIHLTGREFQFSILQLNTLDLEDTNSTSVKNNVWITEKMELFSEIKNDLGKEIFHGYNPEILKLVGAMYLS